ncbi:MAG: sensor histidine kinase [Xanthobacteraceae bacterium]
MPESQSSIDIEDGPALSQAILDTVQEALLVLDKDLRVVAASCSFYRMFQASRDATEGRPLYALGDGQWDIPALRLLLEKILPDCRVMGVYEVEQVFPGIGRRSVRLNARRVFSEGSSHTTLLLSIEDITERRAAERESKELLEQKEVLLQEMQHRFANSLQIIASILLVKARMVRSEETRQNLQEAHKRILLVAAVQAQLYGSGAGEPIEMAPYLTKLCETLSASLIGDTRPISLKISAGIGCATARQAVSVGLIVTELVINSLKHAFPDDKRHGEVVVAYKIVGTNWTLSVSDNGNGNAGSGRERIEPGLGTSIIKALAQQLDATVEATSGPSGTTVSIVHAPLSTFSPMRPERQKPLGRFGKLQQERTVRSRSAGLHLVSADAHAAAGTITHISLGTE